MGSARPLRGPWVEVRSTSAGIDPEQARAWCQRQTLREIQEVVSPPPTHPVVEGFRSDREADWFLALGSKAGAPLPEVHAAWLESAVLVAAAESVEAVYLAPDLEAGAPSIGSREQLLNEPELRQLTLWSSQAFDLEPDGQIRPRRSDWTAKILPLPLGTTQSPYLGPRREIAIDDLSQTERLVPTAGTHQPLLVLTPFLARGGAEHTLLESLRPLLDRFEVTLVTLAPHRPELGDRRRDFLAVTPRLLCLGDLVHPAAMPGILRSILASTGARVLYNANSTTLFYDFAPGLKQHDPQLRILDHLYDHEVGYIERYSEPGLLESIDACVAENHLVARRLREEFDWPANRVPVVWPCGRAEDELPPVAERPTIRETLRRSLDLEEGDLVFLTAARMHEQKRPLDLVELARRVSDLSQVQFLVAGGGPLEADFDAAVARHPEARIRRLGFRSDVPDLVLAADCGLLVSAYEGLPVFMMECFQLGRPFLGTDVGDLGRVLRETGAGLVVDEPGDLDALEAAVRRLVEPETYRDLTAATAAAARQFSVTACAERYAAVFAADPTA